VNSQETRVKFSSGRLIAKHTIYNLLGYGIPLIVALIVIPLIITGLGKERFGILNLVWVVVGYFSFFDFGIGRTLTKIIAEKIGSNQTAEIPSVFWTSFILMLVFSLSGTIILLFSIPFLINNFFVISQGVQKEALYTFYILAISIPIVTTTAGLRGVLEAYQKFGAINIIRTLLGIFTFLIPLLCLVFINSLFWIVILLILIRILIWVLYLVQCFKINVKIKKEIKFKYKLVVPILKLGGWITVANLVAPFLIYSDRFLIGALVSATAVAYYATPYEVVTKLLLISGALVVVLFPMFSASFSTNPDFSKKIFIRGTKFIFLILYPIILLIVTFAYQGINLWLGTGFANNSSFVLQLLAVGVLLNSLASIPFNFFQGVGRPKIPAIINSIELPFYLLLMWLVIGKWGINGAAFVWLFRIIIDSAILFFVAKKMINIHLPKLTIFIITFLILILTVPFFTENVFVKIIFVFIMFIVYLLVSWNYLLRVDEKVFFISKIKKVNFLKV